MDYILVFVTTSTLKEANCIARYLLKKRLAACVNIISDINSIFRWKEKLERASEHLLIIKSRRVLLDKLISSVKKLHSYEVPEVIALPLIGGNNDFLKWIKESVKCK